jgi:hypothetical protein
VRLTLRAPVGADELSITFSSRKGAYDFATKICEISPGGREMIFKSDEHYPETIKIRPGRDYGSASYLNFSTVVHEGNFVAGISYDLMTSLVAGLIAVSGELWKDEVGGGGQQG